jgi:hypothetical protein
MACIYGLYDKQGRLLYIGKANDAQARLKSHMRDSVRRHTPLYCWIRKHGSPSVVVLEADCVDWQSSEQRLIAEAKANGIALLNLAPGGDQPLCDTETRRKNANTENSKREADPFLYARHSFLREGGKVAKWFESSGDTERAARVRASMARIRALDPDVLGYRLLKRPDMIRHFPAWMRDDPRPTI